MGTGRPYDRAAALSPVDALRIGRRVLPGPGGRRLGRILRGRRGSPDGVGVLLAPVGLRCHRLLLAVPAGSPAAGQDRQDHQGSAGHDDAADEAGVGDGMGEGLVDRADQGLGLLGSAARVLRDLFGDRLPAPAVEGIPPFAADFLLDTTRAAYLLVRNGIARTYPNIRFILSHAGGFVPYASHRMAVAIAGDTGRSPLDVLDDFRAFYFDTALSSSPAPCPPCSPSPAPGTSSSAATGPSPPPLPASTSRAASTPAWTPTSSRPSTAATPKPCSPAWPPPPHPLRLRLGQAAQRAAARLVFKLVRPGTD